MMDGKGRLGVRNWDFSGHCVNLEPALKALPEPPSSQNAISHHQASFLKMSGYQDRALIGEPEIPTLDFSWAPQRNFLSATKSGLGPEPQNPMSPEISAMPRFPASGDDALPNNQIGSKPKKSRKRHPSEKKAAQASNDALKTDHHKKQSSGSNKKKNSSTSTGTREKKNPDIVYEGMTFDFSGVPSPVCSCTGVPRQCYRWGAGGWQSSCCTTTISEYPLPMSPSRPGARVAGRKMSIGAYGKLLQRLAAEGQDLSLAVDLKNHWARHGTNKFVTIR